MVSTLGEIQIEMGLQDGRREVGGRERGRGRRLKGRHWD
jgi:hypothetical protein